MKAKARLLRVAATLFFIERCNSSRFYPQSHNAQYYCEILGAMKLSFFFAKRRQNPSELSFFFMNAAKATKRKLDSDGWEMRFSSS